MSDPTSLPDETVAASDRRSSQRLRALKGATIKFGWGTFECTVRNLSERGALLRFGSTTGVPANFTLVLRDGTLTRNCRVRRMTPTEIGVEFVDR